MPLKADHLSFFSIRSAVVTLLMQNKLSDTCLTVLSRPRCCRPPLQPSPGCWAICCVCGSFWAGCGVPGRWPGGSRRWCGPAEVCRSSYLRQRRPGESRCVVLRYELPFKHMIVYVLKTKRHNWSCNESGFIDFEERMSGCRCFECWQMFWPLVI